MNNTSKSDPTMHIRPMLMTDLTAVMANETTGHEFPWTESIIHDCILVGYQCWVIETDAGLQGHGIMSMSPPDESHILNICIKPTEQRKGYGRAIMLHLLQVAKDAGARCAFLEVRASNYPAIALYQQLGFNQIHIREGYYPAPNDTREDAIVLALEIK